MVLSVLVRTLLWAVVRRGFFIENEESRDVKVMSRRASSRIAKMKTKGEKGDLKGGREGEKEKSVEIMSNKINVSHVQQIPSIEILGEISLWDEERENPISDKSNLFKMNPPSEDFSYLDDDNTSIL